MEPLACNPVRVTLSVFEMFPSGFGLAGIAKWICLQSNSQMNTACSSSFMKCIRIYEAMKCKGALLPSHRHQSTKMESRNDTLNVSTPVFPPPIEWQETGIMNNFPESIENFSYYLFIYNFLCFHSGSISRLVALVKSWTRTWILKATER